VPILDPSIYGLWVGKQTAKGTPNTTPSRRLVWVSGDFNFTRDDGREVYSDLTKYGTGTDWVNSLSGAGEPAIEATPTELAYLLWLFHGAETVTAVTGPPTASKHHFEPSTGIGHWFSAHRRVGGSNLLTRQAYNDCLVTRVVIAGSTGDKAVKVTPRILSLDPGNVLAADPAPGMPTERCFLFTEGAGAFTIDGTVIRGHSAFTFTADEAREPVYGDDTTPLDMSTGDATAGVTVTIYFDADGLAQWNKLAYGTAAPEVGTKPSRTIAPLGSYNASLKQRDATGALTGRQFDIGMPGVKWNLPDAPGPNPTGGTTEVTLTGDMRPVAGQPAYTLDVYTAATDVAFTT
jgi:hypothetical protein